MKTSLVLVAISCALAMASAAPAQRMGHSNSNAPRVSQTIDLAGKAAMKLDYTSITWANGTWSRALADASKRDKMRERINTAANESPLGSFEADVATMVSGKHVPKGGYELSFGLSEDFLWELRLRGATNIAVPLLLTERAKERRRLTLNLNSGDEDASASLHIVFGNKECELAIVPHLKKDAAKKSGDTVNQKCPFMDEAVDPAVTVSHKGQVIGLCCEDCIDEWKKLSVKERDEHVAKVTTAKQSGTSGSTASAVAVNAKCPIMGGTVDADGELATFKGKKVGFCCPGCKPKWEAWTETKKMAFIAKAEAK